MNRSTKVEAPWMVYRGDDEIEVDLIGTVLREADDVYGVGYVLDEMDVRKDGHPFALTASEIPAAEQRLMDEFASRA